MNERVKLFNVFKLGIPLIKETFFGTERYVNNKHNLSRLYGDRFQYPLTD